MRKKVLLVIYIVVCLAFVIGNSLKKQDAGPGASTMQTLSASEKDKLSQLLQSRGKGYQLGTNCDLQGDIKVHLFFVNDAESQWDPDAITQITNKQILLGLDFLEKEAARYGVALNFSVESHTTGSKTGTPIIYEGKISKSEPYTVDIPSKIAGQFGYESGGVMYAELYEQDDCQETVWLFLVNQDGVSYARKQYEG